LRSSSHALPPAFEREKPQIEAFCAGRWPAEVWLDGYGSRKGWRQRSLQEVLFLHMKTI
jgi:hypothetical protein